MNVERKNPPRPNLTCKYKTPTRGRYRPHREPMVRLEMRTNVQSIAKLYLDYENSEVEGIFVFQFRYMLNGVYLKS